MNNFFFHQFRRSYLHEAASRATSTEESSASAVDPWNHHRSNGTLFCPIQERRRIDLCTAFIDPHTYRYSILTNHNDTFESYLFSLYVAILLPRRARQEIDMNNQVLLHMIYTSTTLANFWIRLSNKSPC